MRHPLPISRRRLCGAVRFLLVESIVVYHYMKRGHFLTRVKWWLTSRGGSSPRREDGPWLRSRVSAWLPSRRQHTTVRMERPVLHCLLKRSSSEAPAPAGAVSADRAPGAVSADR